MNHVARLLSSRSTPMGHSGGGGGNEGTSRKTAFRVTASIQQNDRCTSRSNKESPPIEHRTSFAAQKNVHCAVNCNTSRLYPKNQLMYLDKSVGPSCAPKFDTNGVLTLSSPPVYETPRPQGLRTINVRQNICRDIV